MNDMVDTNAALDTYEIVPTGRLMPEFRAFFIERNGRWPEIGDLHPPGSTWEATFAETFSDYVEACARRLVELSEGRRG